MTNINTTPETVAHVARKIQRTSRAMETARQQKCHSAADFSNAAREMARLDGKLEALCDLFEDLTGEVASSVAVARAVPAEG